MKHTSRCFRASDYRPSVPDCQSTSAHFQTTYVAEFLNRKETNFIYAHT